MKTEKEKMADGEEYSPYDPELTKMHRDALTLLEQYNNRYFVRCDEGKELLHKLLPHAHP